MIKKLINFVTKILFKRQIGMMEDLIDINDVKRILEGDISSFSRLVDRYQPMIFSIALQITRSTEDAEEITQDVFMKIFNSLEKFNRKSKFSTWAYRISYNTAISKVRKRKLNSISTDFIDIKIEDDNTYDIEKEELLNKLSNAIQNLPSDESVLITLYYMKNISVKDIAEITGDSESNTKVKLHRIRKKLHKMITENI